MYYGLIIYNCLHVLLSKYKKRQKKSEQNFKNSHIQNAYVLNRAEKTEYIHISEYTNPYF